MSQYWKAWTKVMLRMPPDITLTSTTTATSVPPTQCSVPATVARASPAPWNCGIRYSQPMPTTSSADSRRMARDSRRSSAKSGSV